MNVLPLVFGSAVAALVTLSGCSRDNSDLQRYVDEVRARKTTAIEPIPQMKQYVAFSYAVESRRDPFVNSPPDRSHAGGDAVRPDLARNKEALEEFPLDALHLVGLIKFNKKVYAMIKAPDAVIHRVTIGDHLGQNYGRIVNVAESEVTLSEIIADGFGGFIERPATLAAAESQPK